MNETVQNILYIIGAGLLLFAGVFILRFVIRFTWKFVRAVLIILSLIIITGYYFGFFNIAIQ